MKALRPPNSSEISPVEEELSGVRPLAALFLVVPLNEEKVEFSGVRPLAALFLVVPLNEER